MLLASRRQRRNRREVAFKAKFVMMPTNQTFGTVATLDNPDSRSQQANWSRRRFLSSTAIIGRQMCRRNGALFSFNDNARSATPVLNVCDADSRTRKVALDTAEDLARVALVSVASIEAWRLSTFVSLGTPAIGHMRFHRRRSVHRKLSQYAGIYGYDVEYGVVVQPAETVADCC